MNPVWSWRPAGNCSFCFLSTSTKKRSKELLGLYLTKILIRKVGFLRICFNLQFYAMATQVSGCKNVEPFHCCSIVLSTSLHRFHQKQRRKRTKRSCEPKREPSTSLSLSNSGSFVSESCIDQSQIADINSLIKEISWWLAAGSNGRSDSPHIADLICLWCVASGGIGIGFHRM